MHTRKGNSRRLVSAFCGVALALILSSTAFAQSSAGSVRGQVLADDHHRHVNQEWDQRGARRTLREKTPVTGLALAWRQDDVSTVRENFVGVAREVSGTRFQARGSGEKS